MFESVDTTSLSQRITIPAKLGQSDVGIMIITPSRIKIWLNESQPNDWNFSNLYNDEVENECLLGHVQKARQQREQGVVPISCNTVEELLEYLNPNG